MNTLPSAATIRLQYPYENCIHPHVLRYMVSNDYVRPCVVACSGGADSVFLALLLWAHSEHLGIIIHLAHYNHNLRGADSKVDAQYVAYLARCLGCEFHSDEGLSISNIESKPSEAFLRTQRHAFLRSIADTLGASYLCFGHHQDDCAETVLMRLAKGSGLEGLSAPRPVQAHNLNRYIYLRPLLNLQKAWIEAALTTLGVSWRKDASNAQNEYLRNRVRNTVLPELVAAVGPETVKLIAHTRMLLQADDEALNTWLHELYPDGFDTEIFYYQKVLGKPRAIFIRALRAWLSTAGLNTFCTYTFLNYLADQCLQSIEGERKVSIGSNFLSLCAGSIRIVSKVINLMFSYNVALNPPATLMLSTGYVLSFECCICDSNLIGRILDKRHAEKDTIHVDASTIQYPLIIRNWNAGDTYRPLGALGRRKLQDQFTDHKWSVRHKHTIPVIASADETLIGVPGLLPAEMYKITEATHTVLKISYTKYL